MNMLDDMVKEHEDSLKADIITEKDALEIKRIYHRLVKKIHPDINPSVEGSVELMDLWNRVVVCYNCNDIKELRELEVLVAKALEDFGNCGGAVDIPNLDEKIKAIEEEITKTTETDPYQYKFLLTDADAVASKKEELNGELK